MHNDSKSAQEQTAQNRVTPEWDPPKNLTDPLVRRLLIDRATWMRAMRGRIPKIQDRAVAMALGTYGNKDGSSNYPGVAGLAEDLYLSASTVKRALAWLTENGWLARTKRGDRWAGRADEYHLALPAPVAAEIGRWTPEKSGAQWMQRPANEPKRPGMRTRPDPERQGRQGAGADPDGDGDRGPKEETGVRKGVVRGPSSDLPPEPVHQSLLHHSELPARPRADAQGAMDPIDSDGDDLTDDITVRVEELTGAALDERTCNLIDSMLANGAHPKMIVNAAYARERDAWGA